MAKQKNILDQARDTLERYCEYQPRSQEQVIRKLHQMRLNQDAKDDLLIEAIEKKWINESFFASQYAVGKFRQKKWGRVKIREGLKRQGVGEPILTEALSEIEEEAYRETIQDLAVKKWPQIKAKNHWEQKQKVFRYLASKGFESAVIYETLDALEADNFI